MNGKWLSFVVLAAAGGMLFSLASCGRDQELVSIEIQPGVETFGAADVPVIQNRGSSVQLRALGTYIHPPVTKDITSQVTWSSNDTQMMTVDATGKLTATGLACGGTLVSATVKTGKSAGGISSSGAIVTGTMQGNVVCFTGTGGGGGPALSVTFGAGAGSGTVTDSALNFTCNSPSPCIVQFASGTTPTLTLTATPTGSSQFGSWVGCDSLPSVNPCTVTLTVNRTVTATFN
jgi:hypothetical protein